MVLSEFDGEIARVAWSPDVGKLACVVYKGGVHVFDTSNGKREHLLELVGTLNGLLWNNDGSKIVTVEFEANLEQKLDGEFSAVKIWSTRSGKQLADHKVPGYVMSATRGPNEQQVILSGMLTPRLLDLETGVSIREFPYLGSALASSGTDGARLLTYAAIGTVRGRTTPVQIVDANDGKQQLAFIAGTDIVDARWSPDGQFVLSATLATLRIHDSRSSLSCLIDADNTDDSPDTYRRRSPSGTMVLFKQDGDSPTIRDARTRQAICVLKDHVPNESGLFNWSDNGALIYTPDFNREGRVWNARTGEVLHRLQGTANTNSHAKMSPDGSHLIISRVSSNMADPPDKLVAGNILMALDGKLQVRPLVGHSSAITEAVWSPDGKQVATTAFDRQVVIRDALSGAPLITVEHTGNSFGTPQAARTPDSRQLVTSLGNQIQFWEAKSGTRLHSIEIAEPVMQIIISADGERVLTVLEDNSQGINQGRGFAAWDVRSGQQLLEIDFSSIGNLKLFDNDERLQGDRESTRLTWNMRPTACHQPLPGHDGDIGHAYWNNAGTRVASCCSDGIVRIWNAEDGRLLREPMQPLSRGDSNSAPTDCRRWTHAIGTA